jgi:hypothetical protein
MIYRGTDHEFSRQSWDNLCINKGPTLTVIQSTKGHLIGGYTSKSMTRLNNDWSTTEDDKAWIFTFHHCLQLKIKKKYKQYAISSNNQGLCRFGLNDLIINENPHLRKDNSAFAGRTY